MKASKKSNSSATKWQQQDQMFVNDNSGPAQGTNAAWHNDVRRSDDILNLVQGVLGDHAAAIQDSAKRIEILRKETESLHTQLGGYKKRVGIFESQLKQDRNQSVQVLAIFVAFFTFVSVDFQLFSHLKSPLQAVALILILMGGLNLFALLILALTAHDSYMSLWRGWLLGTSLMLLAVGILFEYLAFYEQHNRNDNFCTRLETSLVNMDLGSEKRVQLNATYLASGCADKRKNDP